MFILEQKKRYFKKPLVKKFVQPIEVARVVYKIIVCGAIQLEPVLTRTIKLGSARFCSTAYCSVNLKSMFKVFQIYFSKYLRKK